MATVEELLEQRAALVADITVNGAITSVSVDGMSFTQDRRQQLAALDSEIARLQSVTPNNRLGIRFYQIVPPGGGGS